MTLTGELRLANDRRLLTAMLVLQSLPPMWFGVQDAVALWGTDGVGWRLVVRALPIIPPLVGLSLVSRVRSQASYSRLAFATGILFAVALMASNLLRPDSEAVPLRGRLVTIVLMYLLLPNSFARQVGPPVALSAGLAGLRFWRLGPMPDMVGDLLLMAVLNAAGMLMVWRRIALEAKVDRSWAQERDARQAAERAMAELKTLRGIIPICSHCKKVRTEVGDWQQIERYVHDHTEAQFSHGVCPDCRATHYAEFSAPRARA